MVGFQSKLKRTADAHVLFTMYMFCSHSKAKTSVGDYVGTNNQRLMGETQVKSCCKRILGKSTRCLEHKIKTKHFGSSFILAAL